MTKFLTFSLPLLLLAGCSTQHHHTTSPTSKVAVNTNLTHTLAVSMTQNIGQETRYQRTTRSYFVEPQQVPGSLQDGTIPQLDVVRYEPVLTPGCSPSMQALRSGDFSFQQNVQCW